jgi:hypothetical protein
VDGEKLPESSGEAGDVPLIGTIKADTVRFTYTVNYNGTTRSFGDRKGRRRFDKGTIDLLVRRKMNSRPNGPGLPPARSG